MLPFCAQLDQNASLEPNKIAIRKLNKKGDVTSSLTYQDLCEQSKRCGARLLEKGIRPGQLVLVVYSVYDVLEYLIAFMGCLRVGIVPVSIYPPNPKNLDSDLKKLDMFLKNSGATIALTTSEYKRFVQVSSKLRAWPHVSQWIATDRPFHSPTHIEDHVYTETSLVFVQYTSGSTGDPKGVMVHHASFMNTIHFMGLSIRREATSNLKYLLWLPISHDYGLISNLITLYNMGELYILDPLSFIQNPLLWPMCMERYHITHTAGPTFSYALTAKRIQTSGKQYDLSRLVVISFGAEPITATAIESTVTVLGIPREKIVHGYGFAEACLLVGAIDTEFDPETGIAASGFIENSVGVRFLIVQDGIALPDGETGLLYVQGPSIAAGYFRKPQETKEAFENVVQGYPGVWYNSGDLAYIKDGRFYITGRVKDVLIINGRNVYAPDMERFLEDMWTDYIRPGCSAAFQTGDDTAVIVCEYRAGRESSLLAEQLKIAKDKLDLEFGLQVTEIVLCPKSTVPKTTSGKVQRRETKSRYLQGTLTALHKMETQRKAKDFTDLLHQYGVVDFEKTIIENGIDSVKLSRLMEEARNQFGMDLDLHVIQSAAAKDVEQASKTVLDCIAPAIPPCTPSTGPVRWNELIQVIMMLTMLLMVVSCSLPSVALYTYLVDPAFLQRNASIIDPLLSTFQGGPGIILIAIPVLWMFMYTLLVIVLKWVVIGRYKPGSHTLWDAYFCRWWFMDRMIHLWENTVGMYLLDTPYLHLFYWALGCPIPLNCRIKTFLREWDLVHVERNTLLHGILRPIVLSTDGLVVDSLVIKEDTSLESWTVAYPGHLLDHKDETSSFPVFLYPTNPMSLFLRIERTLFPFILLITFGASSYLMSWATQRMGSTGYMSVLGRIVVTFFGSAWSILVFTGLLVRLRCDLLCAFTIDKLSAIAYAFLHFWISYSPLTILIHNILYGAQISIKSQMNSFETIVPSEARFVSIGEGSTVSYGTIRASAEQPVRIGKNVTLGISHVIQPGCTIEDQGVVPAYVIVPPNTVVASQHVYFSPLIITKTSSPSPRSAPPIWVVFQSLLIKMIIGWPITVVILASGIAWGTFLHYSIDTNIYLKVVLLFLNVLIACTVVLLVFMVVCQRLVPTPTEHGEKKILGPYEQHLYMIYLQVCNMVDSYVACFLLGSTMWTLLQQMGGLKVPKRSRVLLMGYMYDAKVHMSNIVD
jgi:acyl-CoA synthetase (AMP-forming)/AMP-acid ligase II